MSRIRCKWVFIIASAVALIYTPEVAIATMGWFNLRDKESRFGIRESRYEAIQRLGINHGGNGRTFSVLGIPNPPHSPVGTWTNSLILGFPEGDGDSWPVHRTDGVGFFNEPEWWRDPQILILGDSFVTCEHLQTNSITRLVRERVAPAVNLGVTGSGPLTALAALKSYWPKLSNSVRMVVWCYYEGNDLQDAAIERRTPFFAGAMSRNFESAPDQSLLRLLPRTSDKIGHGWAWAFQTVLTMSRTRQAFRYYQGDSDGAAITAESIKEGARYCAVPMLLIRIRRGDTYIKQLDREWDLISRTCGVTNQVEMNAERSYYTPAKILAHYSHHGYDQLCEAIRTNWTRIDSHNP